MNYLLFLIRIAAQAITVVQVECYILIEINEAAYTGVLLGYNLAMMSPLKNIFTEGLLNKTYHNSVTRFNLYKWPYLL